MLSTTVRIKIGLILSIYLHSCKYKYIQRNIKKSHVKIWNEEYMSLKGKLMSF